MSALRSAHRLGAISYLLWGMLHLALGAFVLWTLRSEGARAAFASVYQAGSVRELPAEVPGVVGAVLAQHAWNLAWIGLFALAVAATLNWRNSRTGYWLNLAVVSAADLGFLATVLLPGYADLGLGLVGPILWLLGAGLTTIGLAAASPVAAATVVSVERVRR